MYGKLFKNIFGNLVLTMGNIFWRFDIRKFGIVCECKCSQSAADFLMLWDTLLSCATYIDTARKGFF